MIILQDSLFSQTWLFLSTSPHSQSWCWLALSLSQTSMCCIHRYDFVVLADMALQSEDDSDCSWRGMNILVQGIFPLRPVCWVT